MSTHEITVRRVVVPPQPLPPPPPVVEYHITLDEEVAKNLVALLGQFGNELPIPHNLYYALSDEVYGKNKYPPEREARSGVARKAVAERARLNRED